MLHPYGSRCEAKEYEEAFSNGGVDDVLFHVRESAGTLPLDRLHGFVIGSIREPCSQYLSLWTFGSHGGGSFQDVFTKHNESGSELFGESSPYFNTTSDKERFRAWTKHPLVAGVVGKRVKSSYGKSVLDTVDCWVFVEDLRDSLLGCLRMYEDQGGFVDWQAPSVSAMLLEQGNKRNKMVRYNRGLGRFLKGKNEGKNKGKNKGKNNPLGDPRSSHHGKCESMFDVITAEQVETTESFVYDLFGYEGCCKPGTNFYPRGDTGLLHLDIVKNLSPFDHTDGSTIASPVVVDTPKISFTNCVVADMAMITGILLLTFHLYLRRQHNKPANPGGECQYEIAPSAETELSAAEDGDLPDQDEVLKSAPLAEDGGMPLRRMEIE